MRTLKLKNRTFDVYDFASLESDIRLDNFLGFRIGRTDFFQGTKSITLVSVKNPQLFYNVSEKDVLLTSNGKVYGTLSEDALSTLFDTGLYKFLGGNKREIEGVSVVGIVAKSIDNVIGFRDDQGKDIMPWGHSLKNDLKAFKAVTNYNVVVMGRVTFDSLGRKPLPNRLNIVISTLLDEKDFSQYDNILIIPDVHQAMFKALEVGNLNNCDVYVMGGATIYDQTMDLCNRYLITEVQERYDKFYHESTNLVCMSLFANERFKGFEEVQSSEEMEEDGIKYTFNEFKRTT